MANTRFTYNPASCRYEPAKVSFVQVLSYGFSVLLMSVLLFVVMAYLQSRFFTTQATLDLRAENRALDKHHHILHSEMMSLNASLANIKVAEKSVQSKLFSTAHMDNQKPRPAYQPPAGIKEARKLLHSLQNKVTSSLNRAALHNYHYAATLNLTANEKSEILNWPTGQPVAKKFQSIASGFGQRINPFHKGVYQHQGVDYAAPKGTPVYATASGKVIDTGKSDLQVGYGNYIEIDHGNGIITRYAHLQDITVKSGQAVGKGALIGSVGMSGGASAPHLHYEIWRNEEPVNPMHFMMEDLTSSQFNLLKIQAETTNQSLD